MQSILRVPSSYVPRSVTNLCLSHVHTGNNHETRLTFHDKLGEQNALYILVIKEWHSYEFSRYILYIYIVKKLLIS